jgi:uncharacterized protein
MTELLAPADGAELAGLAVAAVAARLLGRPPAETPPSRPTLRRVGATFVTLECRGQLRGCIGTIEPARPLWRDAARNALRAMSDPRLPPVTVADWCSLDVKVSVLGAPEPLACGGRDELVALLRPGVDGLLVTDGYRRATFLPTVWSKLPDPARFVAALLAKGGWPNEPWPARMRVRRYTAAEFADPAPREPLALEMVPGRRVASAPD